MKRLFYILLFCTVLPICASAQTRDLKHNPQTFAHRGCWFGNIVPENTLSAVRMAKKFGYIGIELDVRYTSDGVMVIMHDDSINRTMRNASDYSEIKEWKEVAKMTFQDLRENYIIASDNPSMREKIPTLEELLLECKAQGIIPMLHSRIVESYAVAQEIMGDGNWIAFDADYEAMKKAREITNGLILYSLNDDAKLPDVLNKLEEIGQPCGISTMSTTLLTKEFNKELTDRGYAVQASIFRKPDELTAYSNDVTIQLSDFCVMPEQGLKTVDKWKKKNVRLQAGESLKKSGEEMEYGAVILNIKIKGEVEILINNDCRYVLSDEKISGGCIGIRFNNTIPSVEITAAEDSIIEEMTMLIQRPRE